jgi:hypothetical protein
MDVEHSMIDVESSVVDTISPGDEGIDISHEGGEYEAHRELAAGYTHLMGR